MKKCRDREATCSSAQAFEEIATLLPLISRQIQRHADLGVRKALAPQIKLSPRHGTALGVLASGPKTVGELAAQLRLKLPTVSLVIADLDAAGIVERYPDPEDRRRTVVTIRSERYDDVIELLRWATAPIKEVLKRLTPAERAAWVKATRMLAEHLDPGVG